MHILRTTLAYVECHGHIDVNRERYIDILKEGKRRKRGEDRGTYTWGGGRSGIDINSYLSQLLPLLVALRPMLTCTDDAAGLQMHCCNIVVAFLLPSPRNPHSIQASDTIPTCEAIVIIRDVPFHDARHKTSTNYNATG